MTKSISTFFFILILAAALTVSCTKDVQEQNNKAKKTLLAIYDPTLYGSCFSVMSIGDEFVINDSIEYKTLEDSMRISLSSTCDTACFAKIDFNTFTLIGKKVDLSLCDSITREIAADTIGKKYVYTIQVQRHVGFCVGVLKISMNWVLVPKLPDTYKVEFNFSEN